jgi:hypothetical protein
VRFPRSPIRDVNSTRGLEWSTLIRDPYVKAAFERAKDDPHDPAPVETPDRPRHKPGGATVSPDFSDWVFK